MLRSETIYKIYLLLISTSAVAFIIAVLRSTEYLRWFNRSPDIYFWLYLFVIILGTFSMYRLTQFYHFTGSTEYLLISGFIYGTGVSLFLWQLWTDYFSTITEIGTQGDLIVFELLYPELIFGRFVYYFGIFLILIHLVRLRSWDSYSRPMKVYLSILMIETLLIVLRDFMATVHGALHRSDPFPAIFEDYWFLHLSIAAFVMPKLGYGAYSLFGTYIWTLLVYQYLTIDLESQSFAAVQSKRIWLVFGITRVFFDLLAWYRDITLTDEDVFKSQYEVGVVTAAISFLLILLILSMYPEALILTKYQLLLATKLYGFAQETTTTIGGAGRFDYTDRVRDYIANLSLGIDSMD